MYAPVESHRFALTILPKNTPPPLFSPLLNTQLAALHDPTFEIDCDAGTVFVTRNIFLRGSILGVTSLRTSG